MLPILTQTEWMVRVLIGHFGKQGAKEPYKEVFIICFKNQKIPGGCKYPEYDCKEYLENRGCVPAYVQAEFYDLFPWNRPVEIKAEIAPKERLPIAAE